MTLNEMLLKIKEGVPVNFNSLKAKLPAAYPWNKVFCPELISKNKYLVQVVSDELFERLLDESSPPTSRAEAARHQITSSHSVKCDSAFKLVFPNCLINEISNPQVITSINTKTNFEHIDFASRAILIENQDCFFRYKTFLKSFDCITNDQKYDIIFAAGTQILDNRFHDLLKKYKQVYCLFDYDLAGLSIFNSFKHSINQNSQFLLPHSLNSLTSLFTMEPKNSAELLSAINLALAIDLTDLAGIFGATKCFMEQEALIK